MSTRFQLHSLGGAAASIANGAAVHSQAVKIDRAQDIKAVSFEGAAAMADGGTHVVVELYRVRAATATKIYAYTFAANSVAWTPVSLAAEAVTNGAKLLDGDRLYAKVSNGTGAAVAPLTFAVHVECEVGLEPATTELYAS